MARTEDAGRADRLKAAGLAYGYLAKRCPIEFAEFLRTRAVGCWQWCCRAGLLEPILQAMQSLLRLCDCSSTCADACAKLAVAFYQLLHHVLACSELPCQIFARLLDLNRRLQGIVRNASALHRKLCFTLMCLLKGSSWVPVLLHCRRTAFRSERCILQRNDMGNALCVHKCHCRRVKMP